MRSVSLTVRMASMHSNSAPTLPGLIMTLLMLVHCHCGTSCHALVRPSHVHVAYVSRCDRSAWQLRKVAACEAALERVVLEADEALVNHGQMGRTGSDQVLQHLMV